MMVWIIRMGLFSSDCPKTGSVLFKVRGFMIIFLFSFDIFTFVIVAVL